MNDWSRVYLSLIFFFCFILFGCQADKETTINNQNDGSPSGEIANKMLQLDPEKTNVKFINRIVENVNRNASKFDYFYNGGGVAIGDVNNDGLSDIFFTGNDSPNALYINKGNMQFEDVSQKALPQSNKWATGCNMIDINSDGYLDIYVGYAGPDDRVELKVDEFLINDRKGNFTNQASKYGLIKPLNTIHSSFFDYDNDGDLDLWINTHSNFKGNVEALWGSLTNGTQEYKEQTSVRLFRNDDGFFNDVTDEAQIFDHDFGLGLVTADFNDDGFIDVYVANDYFIADFYYKNNGDGTFTKVIKTHLDHLSFFSMGCDAADINNDGILDLAVVDMTPADHVRNKELMESMDVERFRFYRDKLKFKSQYMFNVLQMGVGDGYFTETGKMMGVSQTEWSWAALLADFDRDGYKDYFISNGYYRDTKNNDYIKDTEDFIASGVKVTEEIFQERLATIPRSPVLNKLFINQSGEKFTDVTGISTNYQSSYSNGAAYGDLDNDGDLDIVVNNLDSPAHILENQLSNHSFIGIKLNDNKNPSSVLHAKVFVTTEDGITQRMDYQFSRGYQSSVEPRLVFGLGDNKSIAELKIEWLDGSSSTIDNLSINRYHVIEKSKTQMSKTIREEITPLFKDISRGLDRLIPPHQEKEFDDFAKEILLPQKYSTLGPSLCIGDINKDGRDDMIIGSSVGEYSKIVFTNQAGFKSIQLPFSEGFEHIGSCLFDFDNDGDLDLYAALGGGGDISSKDLLMDKLYINDGTGKFTLSPNALNMIGHSTQAVVAFDKEGDGDLDLFVGGRNVPGKYPSSASSYLLENDNGVFKNVISKKLRDELPGMITDLEVTDYNNDGHLDIMISAEWSAPKVLINNGKGDLEMSDIRGLEGKKGWWYSITSGDFDGDGKKDYIFGNLGSNNKFQPKEGKPLGVMAADFDNSGSLDIVLTKPYKGNIVPVRGKECSTEQMPFLEDKFPSYKSFANANIIEIFGVDKIEKARKMEANDFRSYVLWGNSGEAKVLPSKAQWGPILDGCVIDVNKDGIDDILVGGNLYDTEPETPSYDGSKGIVFYGSKDQNWKEEYRKDVTGIYLNYNTRSIKRMHLSPNQPAIAVTNNNGPVQMFILN